jgi:hypothetical protein
MTVPIERIETRVLSIHGHRVMLDADLAEMLSSVLNSERAVQVNIAIMRAFVRLRELAASHKDVHRRLDEMEGKYDRQFKVVFDAIRALMEPPTNPRQRIGF